MNLFRAGISSSIDVGVPRRRIGVWLALVAVLLIAADGDGPEPLAEQSGQPEEQPGVVHLVQVPLPLSGSEDTEVMATVDRILDSELAGKKRPLIVFEFSAGDRGAPAKSRFERALSLARYIASDRFSRIRTVAYLPQDVLGHAVLPVLACEEIIAAPDAQLGAAGQDETTLDNTIRAAYREIAMRRRTIPVPVVIGMLDPDETVTELRMVEGGVRYVLSDELQSIKEESKAWKEKTIINRGDLGVFSGRQLRLDFGFASHLAKNRRELESVLQMPPGSLGDNAIQPESWRALQINISGRIVTRTADEVVRAVREERAGGPVNLICLPMNSPGGSVAATLRIVNAIAELGPNVQTVAYIDGEARSVAALVALVCDEVYAAEASQVGGPGITNLTDSELGDIKVWLQEWAVERGRDWSLIMALIDPSFSVYRYRQEGTGQIRLLGDEEQESLPDADQWTREADVSLEEGLTGLKAHEYGLVLETAASFEEVTNQLNIGDDITVARPNRAVTAIERLAGQPWFARTLLFVAFFALISEASVPGVGIAGFVSALCFLLFFWTQFLNGTAGWLEVVLFMGGLVCIGLEIVVIPGFGVFGIGGGVMVLSSLVLASQTFVVPRNSYQMEQLPESFMTIAFAGGGMLTAVWIMRRFLDDSPLARLFTLAPPDEEELDELEAIVDWSYLEHKRGTTTTQLTPSGKAKFGDDVIDVISDGSVIARDVPVVVTEVRGNHVLVEPLGE